MCSRWWLRRCWDGVRGAACKACLCLRPRDQISRWAVGRWVGLRGVSWVKGEDWECGERFVVGSGEWRWAVRRYLEPLCVRDAMGGSVRYVGVFERKSVRFADRACVQASKYAKYLGPCVVLYRTPYRLVRSKTSLVGDIQSYDDALLQWRQKVFIIL